MGRGGGPSGSNKTNAAKSSRLCRNIIIHGFCKYENKGCEFNHDPNSATTTTTTPASPLPKPKATPSPKPGVVSKGIRITHPSEQKEQTLPGSSPIKMKLRVDSPAFQPTTSQESSMTSVETEPFYPQESYAPDPTSHTYGYEQGYSSNNPYASNTSSAMGSLGQSMEYMNVNADTTEPYYEPPQPLAPLDPYYYQRHHQHDPMTAPRQPLQYHLYTTPLPHVSNQKYIHAFFMHDELREELQRRNEAIIQTIDQTHPDYQKLPPEVHVYHSLYPIESHKTDRVSKSLGMHTSVYKAFSNVDGKPYILRRIENYRLVNEAAMTSIEGWRRIRHSNIVSVREAFTTKAFGDHSLVFVYDYHPLSKTLVESNFVLGPSHQGPSHAKVTEKALWSVITQLASAIKAVHAVGLAIRTLDPSKILVTGKNRVRINGSGIMDMLAFETGKSIAQWQQEDLFNFGQLLLVMANGGVSNYNPTKQLEMMARNYSVDIKNCILYLLSKPTGYKSIDDVINMMGPRILHEITSAHYYNDFLESELGRELENSRLVRLLCKMGFINERPEFDMDPSWSETGDRYLIKLFRDYVFHQVDEQNRPVLDLGHVLSCLNKVDVGVDEKMMLTSRDEQSCLIVKYKDIKSCIDGAFKELYRGKAS